MPMKWSAIDLIPVLGEPRTERGELGRWVQHGLRQAVRSGRMRQGEALPGSRELASVLGVARGTVVEAYEQLVAEGYLDARSGAGTVVGTRAGRAVLEPLGPAAVPQTRSRGAVDLRPGVPDLGSFPADDWAWALARAARLITRADLDYSDACGHPFARAEIAGALRRVRSAETTAANVVIGSGFAQCMSLVVANLRDLGVRSLAVEDPGDRSVDEIAAAAGLRVVPVPVDAEGIDVTALAATDAGAVLVTPAHQTPTGAVLSARRRANLIAWAEATDGWIVEDDYDSEFRYDRQPVGALQGLAPDRVTLIGSISKTHAPALRIGWIAAPSALIAGIADLKRLADRGSSGIDQLAFALLVESGRHDRHIRTMRGVYAARRSAIVDALARHAPGLQLTGLAAGFHGVVKLHPRADERAIVEAAAARSVGLRGIGEYSADAVPHPALVLGFGNSDVEQIGSGVAAIADLLG